jgi:transcriptional regulator with XRE-family HTH domain
MIVLVISSTQGYSGEMLESLGALLKKSRTDAGFTLRAVQTQTSISNAYLSQLETGKAENPSPAMLRKLAELYKVRYETLLTSAGYAPEAGPAMRDLFLSHSSKDKSVVRELAGAIESELYAGRQLTWTKRKFEPAKASLAK